MNKINWNEIEIKNKTTGEFSTTCPSCSPTRKNKNGKCLRVNLSKGVGFCHHCGAVAIRDDKPLITNKTYKLPEQTWKNYTELSEGMVKYCESRGISQATLKHFNITEERVFHPQAGREMNSIVFNYFEGDELINKKYRTGAKHFTQSAGTKPIFYNINAAMVSDEVYIVEGEFDVLAMHEAGYQNTISIPNGANDNDDFWINCEPYLSNVKRFYICTDNDEKGEAVAEKIVQRLGRYRCQRVLFQHKDANGDLKEGGADLLKQSVENKKNYPSIGTYTVDDMMDDILSLHEKGIPEVFYPKHRCFGKLKEKFSVMRGHLVVATGIPSHGKSNFVEWYVLNLIRDYGMKASFFSPEHHPMSLHQTTFIEKFFGKSFFFDNPGLPRINKEEIERYREWAREKIYVTSTDADNSFPTWNWLFEKFKEQMFIYGIDVFVIDAFNKLQFDNSSKNELSSIREVLAKLTMFCQSNNVIVFLVAHPRKMQKIDGTYERASLYDVSGSADFRNQTHDGFSVYRHFKDVTSGDVMISKNQVEFIVEKVKMKFQGKMAETEIFNYHLPSGRYYSADMLEPPAFVFDRKELEELPKINAQQAFLNDDLPF